MYVRAVNSTIIKYPYTKADLKAEYPNVSFPDKWSNEMLAKFGVYRVSPTDRPVGAYVVFETPPALVDGIWTQQWGTRNYTPEEHQRAQEMDSDKTILAAVKSDSQIMSLLLANASQIENYIDNNVTNLESAKDVLKILAKAVSAFGRNRLRDN